MIVRKIEDQDLEAVSLLIMRNFNEIMKNYHSEDIIEKFKSHSTIENLKPQMKWKDILVVEDSNEIIATGAVANFGDHQNPRYSISNFFVKPELHRHGIGKILFNELMKIAIAKKAEFFHVPSSRNAVGFYNAMGFTVNESQPELDDEITWMSMKLNNYDRDLFMPKNVELREYILSHGATFCGFADISILPENDRQGMPMGIAFGIALNPKIVSEIPTGPIIQYFDEYDKTNMKLDEISQTVSKYIIDQGYKAIAQTIRYSTEQRRLHPNPDKPEPKRFKINATSCII